MGQIFFFLWSRKPAVGHADLVVEIGKQRYLGLVHSRQFVLKGPVFAFCVFKHLLFFIYLKIDIADDFFGFYGCFI
ncbi:hypothetical protein SDC9_147071 [bioreactor metagenome]|uniref:Uncharacterized protein n=1 Tax=bioreactor metagenome TaxID=1076179 RepID=A0A645EDR3_9ZZZZ